jgi:type IV pilus assembly protein PilP
MALLVSATPALAETAPPPAPAAIVVNTPAELLAGGIAGLRRDVYDYRSISRRDPFFSIVLASKDKKGAIAKVPRESYDLSQMAVTAIIRDDATGAYFAMIGLPDGKFYTIRKGMSLGLHEGVVTRITLQKVVVSEQITNYKGQTISQDTELVLRKGEEQ